jgi:hypothetical protein
MKPDTFILARTDARDVHGLDEAFRRADRYLAAGADGIFIESPHDVGELELIGKKFDVPQMANMLEGGRTPILTPAQLAELGFEIAIYGISLLMHSVHTMQGVLAKLARGDLSFIGQGVGFEEYKTIVGFDDSPLATSTNPQLTSVHQPIEEMGREVARLLVEAVEGTDRVIRRVILATDLVKRASSAGPGAHAAFYETRGLERNTGAAQCSGSVTSARAGRDRDGRERTRPGEQHAVDETLRPEPMEARGRPSRRPTKPPPRFGHRRQSRVCQVEKPSRCHPLGILDDARGRARRAAAQRRPHGPPPPRPWPCSQSREIGNRPAPLPAGRIPPSPRARASRAASRSLSTHPHPLARQLTEPGASRDAGGEPSRIGQPMPISGVKAEEAKDAEVDPRRCACSRRR